MNKSVTTIKSKTNYSLMTLILFWCGLIVMSSMYLTIPLISLFSSTFEVSSGVAAWTSSIFCIFFAVGCLVYGPMSDRYGRKKIILIGMAMLTVVTPLVGLFDNIYWILTMRALQGAVAASFSPVALAYIPEMFPDNKKLTATGFLVTGFLMAGIVGQVISGLINQYLAWNYVFYIMGLTYLVTLVLVLFLLPKDNLPRLKTNIIETVENMASLLKIKPLILCFAVDVMFLMSMMCMYASLGYYLIEPQFGLNSQEILYVRAAGIFGIIFATTSGLFVKKFGIFNVLIGGLLIAAISLTSIAFVNSIQILVLLSVVFVAGIAVTAPALITIIGQVGGQSRGAALSLHTVILFIGAGIGPILAITLLDTGINVLPYLVMGLILLLGVGLSLLIKKSVKIN
ncbi:MAG: MFS transporter [Methanobacterium sp. ERen5]|nr:MAG: MFS transporter [Methanobacterium sp. ERen5]